MRVAVGRLDFEDSVTQLEDRDVVSPTAKVEDRDLLLLLPLEAVSQRRGGWLVDDPQDVKPGDFACVLGSLPLRIVEVSRNRDDRPGHRLAQIILRRLLHLLKDHRRDLGGRVALALDVDERPVLSIADHFIGDSLDLILEPVAGPPHEALDRVNRVFRVGDRLAFRHLTHQTLSVLGESHHRRRRPRTFLVRDHDRVAALDERDDGVRGAQIDPDDFAVSVCHCHSLTCLGTQSADPASGLAAANPRAPALAWFISTDGLEVQPACQAL